MVPLCFYWEEWVFFPRILWYRFRCSYNLRCILVTNNLLYWCRRICYCPGNRCNWCRNVTKRNWYDQITPVFYNFHADKPFEKGMTDMTERKASDGKRYVSAIVDCFDWAVVGLAMDTRMRATLCERTLENADKAYPAIRGCILHSDRGSQYTSELYRKAI